MAQQHIEGKNLINDIIIELAESDFDFSDKNATFEIYEIISEFIENFLDDESDIRFLDFEITFGVDENDIKIKARNIVCGLWFCGLVPKNSDEIYNQGYFDYDGYKYRFNNKHGVVIKNRIYYG